MTYKEYARMQEELRRAPARQTPVKRFHVAYNHCEPWTEYGDRMLHGMADTLSVAELAVMFGRTQNAIVMRLARLGLLVKRRYPLDITVGPVAASEIPKTLDEWSKRLTSAMGFQVNVTQEPRYTDEF